MSSLRPEVLERLRNALTDSESWFDIYSKFKAEVPDGEEESHRSFVWAFGYMLISASDGDRRNREGSPFGALFEFPEGRMPPRLGEVPDEEVDEWRAAFSEIEDPRFVSRVGDLLWNRREQPNAHVKAQAACRALIELSGVDGWEPMEATEGVVRALEIGLELGDETLVQNAVARATEMASEELASEDDRPGIPFSLLRPLVDLKPESQPRNLRELLVVLEDRYDDPNHVESALELRVSVASPEDKDVLRRRQVELWRTAAKEGDGILQASFLEKALDIARTHGFRDLARDLRVEIQGIDEEQMDLKSISTEIKIDREQIDRFHSAFVDRESWQDSLGAFGSYGPPGGQPEKIEEDVKRQMRDFPLQFLINNVVLDPDLGVPLFHANDEESSKLAAMAQARWLASQLWALSAVEILRGIQEKHGAPLRDELADFFTSDFIDATLADRIAVAFGSWWEGRPDESAHILVPRIEAVVRNLARDLGLPIIREPFGGKPGGVRPLGELLHELKGRFASSGWHEYAYHLLSDPLGKNLRNVISHGVRSEIDLGDAALLLHFVSFLRLLSLGTTDHEAK